MLGPGAVLARARRRVGAVRIAVVVALFVIPLALSLLPGWPAHGYGHVLFLLPLLAWLVHPEQAVRLGLYVLAVGLQTLAFPEPDWGFLGWVFLWPYLLARQRDDGAGWFKAAYLFGFFRAMVGYAWLGNVHYTAWVGVGFASALLFAVLFEGGLRLLVRVPFALRAATLWVLFEWAHSWFFGGLPWLYIGHTQYRYLPVIQIADIVGAYGVSFLVAYVQFAVYRRARVELAVAGALLAATLAYGWTREAPASAGRGPGVLMIQTAVPHELKAQGEAVDIWTMLMDGTAKGIDAHPDTDLVVWPETMHPYALIEDDPKRSRRFLQSLRTCGLLYRRPFVYGISSYTTWERFEGYRGHNSAVLARAPTKEDRRGRADLVEAIYRKRRLVPMGEEFLPRRLFSDDVCDRWFEWLRNNLGYPETCDLEAGDEAVIFDAGPGLRCAPLICFEGLYADMARDALNAGEADLLLQLVNNGWFGKSWEQRQMVAIWVFRAVETRTPSFNCANAGVTCAIGPGGEILARYDKVMESGFCHAHVPKRWKKPIFLQGGQWILPALLAVACLICLVVPRREKPLAAPSEAGLG